MALTPNDENRIEFLPWYHPTANFTRCSECGSVVMSGDDQETHLAWHQRMDPACC